MKSVTVAYWLGFVVQYQSTLTMYSFCGAISQLLLTGCCCAVATEYLVKVQVIGFKILESR